MWTERQEADILAGVSQAVKINHRASQKVCLISKGPPQLVRSPELFSETLRDFWPQMMGNVQNISHVYYIIFRNLQS